MEKYLLNADDLELLKAAQILLVKVARANVLRPAQLLSVAKLQYALSQLPKVTSDMNITVSVSSPRKWFGDIETWHWWNVEWETGILRLNSGGHFYRQSTGGDTFTSMMWSVQPGEHSDFSDLRSHHRIVPDLVSYPEGVASVDLTNAKYSIEVIDPENESLEDEDVEEESEESLDDTNVFSLSTVDAAEKLIIQEVDLTRVLRQEPQYAYGVEICDHCQCDLSQRGLFIDGKNCGEMTWANMCVACFNVCGEGIGWGRGQLYARQPNGDWRMIAGFRPRE